MQYEKEFLCGLPLFAGLAYTDMEDIFKSARLVHYEKHQRLHHPGDTVTHLYIVLHGWLKTYKQTQSGEEIVAGILTRGDLYGEDSILSSDGKARALTAEAVTDVALAEIPADILKKETAKNPILGKILISLVKKVHTLQVENEHLAIMNAPQRIACMLLMMSADIKGEGGSFILPFGKSMAAARLGMQRETFSRALAQLRPYGVVFDGAKVNIENFTRLSEFVCTDCSLQAGECQGNRCAAVCPWENLRKTAFGGKT